jgi:EAL and modified HD-GYP domain-containing signal transduction protein
VEPTVEKPEGSWPTGIDRRRAATREEQLLQALIGCQLIVDRRAKAIGCELLFDAASPVAENGKHHDSDRVVLLRNVLGKFGLSATQKKHRVFVRATPEFLMDPGVKSLPSSAIVLELDFSGPPDEALLNRCRMLHERRFTLALSNYQGIDDRSQPLLSILDIVEINLRDCDEQTCQELAGSLSSLPIKLLAQGVDTAAQMAFCQRVGFDLFQGCHVTPPEPMGKRCLPVSRAGLVNLLRLVDSHTDLDTIEDALKKEVSLVYNLLHLNGIAGSEPAQNLGTLRRILMRLGVHSLRRWLQLQLMALDSGRVYNPRVQLLIQAAALRGRMLELLMQKLEPHDNSLRDAAYLTGCLSMMPALLRNAMSNILGQIAIEPDVHQALLSHEGLLGQSLDALESFDKRELDCHEQQLHRLSGGKLHHAVLDDCFSDALAWLTTNEGQDRQPC